MEKKQTVEKVVRHYLIIQEMEEATQNALCSLKASQLLS